MMENLNKTGGLIFSQRILIALVSKGVLREDAYKWVQRNAMKRWLEKEDFKTNISKDEDVVKYLSQDEIDECFKVDYFLRHVDMIMARFGL
jgi:adenylosuccinate lyase